MRLVKTGTLIVGCTNEGMTTVFWWWGDQQRPYIPDPNRPGFGSWWGAPVLIDTR
jgi:hypothetical protein